MHISLKCATDTKSQIRTLNKAREQIEIYLECCVRRLETKSGWIATCFLKNVLFQIKILRFLATRNMELRCIDVHCIELVESYLKMNGKVGKHFRANRNGFYKIWCIFEKFFDDFCRFSRFGDVCCRNKAVKPVEFIEFYLESCYLGWKVKWSESLPKISYVYNIYAIWTHILYIVYREKKQKLCMKNNRIYRYIIYIFWIIL